MPAFAGMTPRDFRLGTKSAMHDIKAIRDNPDAFDAALKRRGLAPLSSSLLAIDEKRRAAILA
jgi:seryl-tRNA synthetase